MAGLFSKVKKFMDDPKYRMQREIAKGKYDHLPDEEFLKKYFKAVFGYELDLENPKTYSEKLQWLKLHDRKDIYTTMVDKVDAKDYVAGIIGEEYIIPTLGVWENADDIDFDALPDQFVLKTTHDSHAVVICKDKSKLDAEAARAKMASGLKRDYFIKYREWPYKNVKPRIIAEQYMEDPEAGELIDYKFFTFDSEVKALFIATERNDPDVETKFDFYDPDFNHLDFVNGHPNSDKPIKKPVNFEKMKELASILSKGTPELRVDFYEVEGKVYFGELTFYHWSGFQRYIPEKWDRIFGDWLTLPEPNA